MRARLLAAGYFGCGNLGDDAILAGFAQGLSGEGVDLLALAGSPERLMRNNGIRGIPRKDFKEIANAIDEVDALVFPGGSIFQDVTSVQSVAYYARLVKMAKKAGKKVIMLGQGVGPLNNVFGKKMAATAFNMADMIVVRDPASVATLKALGVRHTPKVAADMAYLLPVPEMREESQSYSAAGMKSIGISIRPWGSDRNKTVIKEFGDLAKLLYQKQYMPVMIGMDANEDQPLIDEISKIHGGKVPELKNMPNPRQLQERIMRMEAVIGMRLHAGILAATVCVPAYMIAYDPKVTAFSNAMGFPTPPSMQGITAQRIFEGFQSFVQNRDRTVESLQRKREEQVRLARLNIEALKDALG
jgi:polysaccharide pyruvyl transferase CsaB